MMIIGHKYFLIETISYFLAGICGAFEAESLSGTDAFFKLPAAPIQTVLFLGSFFFLFSTVLNFKWPKAGAITAILGSIIFLPLWLRTMADFPFKCVQSEYYHSGFLLSCSFWRIFYVCATLSVAVSAFLAVRLLAKSRA